MVFVLILIRQLISETRHPNFWEKKSKLYNNILQFNFETAKLNALKSCKRFKVIAFMVKPWYKPTSWHGMLLRWMNFCLFCAPPKWRHIALNRSCDSFESCQFIGDMRGYNGGWDSIQLSFYSWVNLSSKVLNWNQMLITCVQNWYRTLIVIMWTCNKPGFKVVFSYHG